MRGLILRAAVAAGAALTLLVPAETASASGTVVLIWSPTTSTGTYSYGTLTVGQTASQTFTLLNSGGANTSALTITLTGPSTFTKIGDACTGAKLKPDTSCNVIVRYAAATSSQNDSATLTAASGKPSATVSLALKGASAKASPAIATTPSAGGTVGSTTVTDTATLPGGYNPTGTITFNLYGPSTTASCSGTPAGTGKVTVSGDGGYTSPSVTPAQAGTYWWTASYNGDVNNNAVSSGCGDEPVTITPATPAISTTQQPARADVGSAVADQATVSGGSNPTGTVTFNLYNNSGCTGPALFRLSPGSADTSR
jgi:hypothetical protein